MNRRDWRPDAVRPLRRPGLAMRRTGGQLKVWSPGREFKCSLNSTAALVWLFCDGKLTVQEIERWLLELYPEQAKLISRQLPDLIDSFLNEGLISAGQPTEAPRPLIKVDYHNFWMGFDIEDNYFLWMLSLRADVMIVEPQVETPDIVLFASGESGPDAWSYDTTEVYRIFVDREGVSRAEETSDFVFRLSGDQPQFRDKEIQLPVWAMKIDWRRYQPDAGEGELIDGSTVPKPEAVVDHMWAALQTVDAGRRRIPEGIAPAPPAGRFVSSASSRSPRKLTIGIPTYDDFDGVYFTLMALKAYHNEVMNETELLIVDNNPGGPCSEALKRLAGRVRGCRYYPYRDATGTAVSKDLVFQLAAAPYVVCLDSHVLLPPGTLRRLVDYFDENPGCQDLLQGPLLHDNMTHVSTHFRPVWSSGMYGQWASDERGSSPGNPPFEIQMQGMGLFACRRDAWLGFNPRFRGFGGEEGYIHEKYRQAGSKTLCLPFLRWLHRFDRPMGVKYSNTRFDRIRNYTIGFRELGLDEGPIEAHFREVVGDEKFAAAIERLDKELAHPFSRLEGVYWIAKEEDASETVERRLKELELSLQVRRYGPDEASESSQHLQELQAYRSAIEGARDAGLKHIVLCSDGCFLSDPHEHTNGDAQEWIDQLVRGELDVVRLGDRPTAVVVSKSIYGLLLDELPSKGSEYDAFLDRYGGFGEYVVSLDNRIVLEPADDSADDNLVAATLQQ